MSLFIGILLQNAFASVSLGEYLNQLLNTHISAVGSVVI